MRPALPASYASRVPAAVPARLVAEREKSPAFLTDRVGARVALAGCE